MLTVLINSLLAPRYPRRYLGKHRARPRYLRAGRSGTPEAATGLHSPINPTAGPTYPEPPYPQPPR